MEGLAFNPVDLAVVAVLLLSAALAFFRGFVHEVLAVGAWVGAGFAGLYGLPLLAPLVRDLIPQAAWAADLVAGVVIFLVVLVLLSMISTALARKIRQSALNALDRSLGFLFGLLRGAVIVVAAYLVLSWITPPASQPTWIREARSLPLVERGARLTLALLPSTLRGSGEGEEEGSGTGRAGDEAEARTRFERLAVPQPKAADRPTAREPGYDSDARQELDRLIETNR